MQMREQTERLLGQFKDSPLIESAVEAGDSRLEIVSNFGGLLNGLFPPNHLTPGQIAQEVGDWHQYLKREYSLLTDASPRAGTSELTIDVEDLDILRGIQLGVEIAMKKSYRDATHKGVRNAFSSFERVVDEHFVSDVEAISFLEVVQLTEKSPNPENLDLYRFIPMVPLTKIGSTLDKTGYGHQLPNGVDLVGKLPFLDAGLGIGLVFNDILSAVSSAGILDDEVLFIKQTQGAICNKDHTGEKFQKYGMHEGILWRKTLVKAWMEIAKQNGIRTVGHLSSKNSRYAKGFMRDRLFKAYDQVALDLGFKQDPQTNNLFLNFY